MSDAKLKTTVHNHNEFPIDVNETELPMPSKFNDSLQTIDFFRST